MTNIVIMPYCNKCGASIPETDEFAAICENCSDASIIPITGKHNSGVYGRRSFPLRVKRYSAGDSAITFAIIFALILLGIIVLGGIL